MLIDLEAAEESLRNTEDEIEHLRVPSHMRNLSRAEMLALYQTHDLLLNAVKWSSPQCCKNGWVIPKRRRRYRWILCGRWSGRLRVEKKQTLPFITETERFSSTTDGPSASVQKAQSSKRSISAVNALHLFKKVVDKRREIWYYISCVRGYSTVG